MVIKYWVGNFLIGDENNNLEKLFQNVDYPVLSAILEADLKTRNKLPTGWCG